jgi:hypothetical protein
MKKNLFIVIGTSLFLCVAILFVAQRYYGNKLDDLETEKTEHVELLEQVMSNTLLAYDSALNLSLEDAIFLDKYGNAMPKDSLSDMLPRLVFRFQTHMCDICINDQLDVINRVPNSADFVMLLPTFHDSRSRKIYHNNSRDYVKIIELKDDHEILKDIDKLNYPYYFVLNKDFTLSHFFIPVNGLSEFSHRYVKTIAELIATEGTSPE